METASFNSGRGGIERALRRLTVRTHRAQPRHQVREGGQDLVEAPGQRAVVGKGDLEEAYMVEILDRCRLVG